LRPFARSGTVAGLQRDEAAADGDGACGGL